MTIYDDLELIFAQQNTYPYIKESVIYCALRQCCKRNDTVSDPQTPGNVTGSSSSRPNWGKGEEIGDISVA